MSEYISKAEVLKLIHTTGGCDANSDYDKGWDKCANHLYNEVASMEIAYNPDKVVAQMENLSVKEPIIRDRIRVGTIKTIPLRFAIEIVKDGGVR